MRSPSANGLTVNRLTVDWPTDARNPVTNRLHGETLVHEIAVSRAAPRTTPDRLITASTARSK